MRSMFRSGSMGFIFLGIVWTSSPGEELLKRIPQPDKPLASAAVVTSGRPLLHTPQFMVTASDSSQPEMTVPKQLSEVLNSLREFLDSRGAQTVVKLNICVTTDAAAESVVSVLSDSVHRYLPHNASRGEQPAISLVVTGLPQPHALVAVDAVAVLPEKDVSNNDSTPASGVLPAGSRIYISGQAEQNTSLSVATRETLHSLRRTLEFLGRSGADIVQLKAFIQPMSDFQIVRNEVSEFFGADSVPPLILVEWQSGASTPVEIELIAGGGDPVADADSLEFLNPPGMTASPIYCRVCRVNSPALIYVSGLYSRHNSATHPDRSENGEIEVRDVFDQLNDILRQTGSDMRHLVKATYYVSTDSASLALNKLRPGYYDATRPPAASKAVVHSVGKVTHGLTMDMIAVPANRK